MFHMFHVFGISVHWRFNILVLTLCLNGKHRCSFTCRHKPADTKDHNQTEILITATLQHSANNNQQIREDCVWLLLNSAGKRRCCSSNEAEQKQTKWDGHDQTYKSGWFVIPVSSAGCFLISLSASVGIWTPVEWMWIKSLQSEVQCFLSISSRTVRHQLDYTVLYKFYCCQLSHLIKFCTSTQFPVLFYFCATVGFVSHSRLEVNRRSVVWWLC